MQHVRRQRNVACGLCHACRAENLDRWNLWLRVRRPDILTYVKDPVSAAAAATSLHRVSACALTDCVCPSAASCATVLQKAKQDGKTNFEQLEVSNSCSSGQLVALPALRLHHCVCLPQPLSPHLSPTCSGC